MEIFSSADRTNSSSLSRCPPKTRSYRSRMREALAAKSGSRGKIQQRCCHGRIASSESQRQTVLSLILATSPERLASLATSVTLSRESGIPSDAGSSQARAFTWMTSSGGENPRAGGALLLVKPRQALLMEPLSPSGEDQPARIQAGWKLNGAPSFGPKQGHPGPGD